MVNQSFPRSSTAFFSRTNIKVIFEKAINTLIAKYKSPKQRLIINDLMR